jgi:hypothetical protein
MIHLTINTLVDSLIRRHALVPYDQLDAEDYACVIEFLDAANTRTRDGLETIYDWDAFHWGGYTATAWNALRPHLDKDWYKLVLFVDPIVSYQEGEWTK